MVEVSVAQARNSLTRLIHEAEGGNAVRITRRGKPVAILVSQEEYDRLESRESKRGHLGRRSKSGAHKQASTGRS